MWFVRPNNAEIDPKVKPVDIINVVYMPSRFSDAGKTALPRNHKAWRLATIDTLLTWVRVSQFKKSGSCVIWVTCGP